VLEEVFKFPIEKLEVIDRRAKMTLGDILATKKSVELIAITPNHKVLDAIKLMNDRNISVAMVVDITHKLKGMLTERDIVRGIATSAASSDYLNRTIEDVMTRDIITFTPSTEVSAAISVVANKKIRHLPILDGDRIIGIITYRDLVSYVLPEIIYMAEDMY
jgi:CBS domain-containing protein